MEFQVLTLDKFVAITTVVAVAVVTIVTQIISSIIFIHLFWSRSPSHLNYININWNHFEWTKRKKKKKKKEKKKDEENIDGNGYIDLKLLTEDNNAFL